MPSIDISVDFDDLIQRIASIDYRAEFSCLDTLREQTDGEFPDLSVEQLSYLLEELETIVHFGEHVHNTDMDDWDGSVLYDLHIPALAKGLTTD